MSIPRNASNAETIWQKGDGGMNSVYRQKTWKAALAAVFCIILAGCGTPVPETAADGSTWSEDWLTLGILGVEEQEGWTLRANDETFTSSGMHYAAWSAGECVPFVNEDGDEADLYDAQIYALLTEYGSAEEAGKNMAQWLDMVYDNYTVEETYTETYNEQTFTLVAYVVTSETNPFERGVSAFGVYGQYAMNIELSCRETFEGDERAVLADFLGRCHYAV